jgi:hypothetical protein
MGELTRGERLQIMLTQEELTALDDWRFARRMPTRAAAIRELLKRGLAVEGLQTADGASKSKDFGVLSDGFQEQTVPQTSNGNGSSRGTRVKNRL